MLLRLSRFFVLLSELLSDVEQWENGLLTWRQIRALRLPPIAEWTNRPDTSRAPFRLPPDIEDTRGF